MLFSFCWGPVRLDLPLAQDALRPAKQHKRGPQYQPFAGVWEKRVLGGRSQRNEDGARPRGLTLGSRSRGPVERFHEEPSVSGPQATAQAIAGILHSTIVRPARRCSADGADVAMVPGDDLSTKEEEEVAAAAPATHTHWIPSHSGNAQALSLGFSMSELASSLRHVSPGHPNKGDPVTVGRRYSRSLAARDPPVPRLCPQDPTTRWAAYRAPSVAGWPSSGGMRWIPIHGTMESFRVIVQGCQTRLA